MMDHKHRLRENRKSFTFLLVTERKIKSCSANDRADTSTVVCFRTAWLVGCRQKQLAASSSRTGG